jgi:hypothetical protein
VLDCSTADAFLRVQQKILKFLCCGEPQGGDNSRMDYSAKGFDFAWKISVSLLSGGLLITPVAILYLVTLTDITRFVVVAAFLSAFVVTMTILEQKASHLILGLSAYGAVLVAFLGNLAQN